MTRLKITQIRSGIGNKQNQRQTLRSLGLKRVHDVVIRKTDRRSAAWSPPCRISFRSRRSTDMGGPLKVHHLRPAAGAHTKTRVGRGNASKGKTAGRGTKGSKARSRIPATFEGGQMPIHMRLPKLKGFNNTFRTEYQVVNVAALAELFPRGGPVGVDALVAAGAVRRAQPVKVLGHGEIGLGQARRHRERILKHGPRQDRGCWRHGHQAVSPDRGRCGC